MDLNTRILDKRYKAMPVTLHVIRQDVRNVLFEMGLSPNQVDPLVLAINEACTNVIEHGYGQQSSGDIIVEAFLNNNEITFQITDFAKSTQSTPVELSHFKDASSNGLGLHFMQQLMDHIEFTKNTHDNGNVIIMKKTL